MDYLKGMSQVMQQAQASNESEKYGYAAVELVKSKDKIREAIEQATIGTVVEIIAKLEKNQPLSEAEKQVVRLWVVGDAEGYLKMENGFARLFKQKLPDGQGSLRPDIESAIDKAQGLGPGSKQLLQLLAHYCYLLGQHALAERR